MFRNRSRRLLAIVGVTAMLLVPLPVKYALAQHAHAGLPVTFFHASFDRLREVLGSLKQ